MKTKPSLVFVHGLWADGSCFSKVIPPLQAEGYGVIASQHSLDSVKGDVATVKRTLGRVSSPAILVGHSYGGRRLLLHRGRGRSRLAAAGRHRLLRGRLVRAGTEAGLGDAHGAGGRPLRAEG